MVTKYGDQGTFRKVVTLTPRHKRVIKDAIDQGLAKDAMSAIQLGIDLLDGRLVKSTATTGAAGS